MFQSHLHCSCTDQLIWFFFMKTVLDVIYDTTDSLQVECFKFCSFRSMQKELDNIKDYLDNHLIRQSMESNKESTGTLDVPILLGSA